MVLVVVLKFAQVRSLSSLAVVLVVGKGGRCRHKITKVWIKRVIAERYQDVRTETRGRPRSKFSSLPNDRCIDFEGVESSPQGGSVCGSLARMITAACQKCNSSSSPFSIPLRRGKSTLTKPLQGDGKCISSGTFCVSLAAHLLSSPFPSPLLLVCKFPAERGRKVKFRPLFCLFVPFFWPSPFVIGRSQAAAPCTHIGCNRAT